MQKYIKKGLKIPKSDSVHLKTDNTMAKRKRTNNDQQNITHKTKDRVTRTPLKTKDRVTRTPLKTSFVFHHSSSLKTCTLIAVLHCTITEDFIYSQITFCQREILYTLLFQFLSKSCMFFHCFSTLRQNFVRLLSSKIFYLCILLHSIAVFENS